MTALQLGDRVTLNAVLFRDFDHENASATWRRFPATPREGVVVGLRRLNEGKIIYPRRTGHTSMGFFDEFDEPEWRTTGTIPAVLVATNIRHKHIYVHLDDIVKKEGVA